MMHPSELLSALLDGELEPPEVVELSQHLDGCGRCREELEGLAEARSAVRSLPLLEVPPEVGLPVADVIPIRRRPAVWAGAAAAALTLGIIGASLTVTPEPAVFDPTELQTVFVARSAVDASFTPTKAAVAPVGAPAGVR